MLRRPVVAGHSGILPAGAGVIRALHGWFYRRLRMMVTPSVTAAVCDRRFFGVAGCAAAQAPRAATEKTVAIIGNLQYCP
ncbi:MAG: hypothetical protein ACRD2O_08895, partial [Terriglobia bacterium]